MSITDLLNIAEWRINAVRSAVAEFLEGSETGDPSANALFTLGRILAALDLSDDQVRAKMAVNLYENGSEAHRGHNCVLDPDRK